MTVEQDGPGSVRASTGEDVVVRLPEVGTTGYQWQVVGELAGVDLVASQFEPPSSAAPGAGGRRVITLRPTSAGEHRVTLERRRAWEPTAAETAEVVITADG